jgi:hypothetical protein
MTQLSFTVYLNYFYFLAVWRIAGTVNITQLYVETVIIYRAWKWFFTVWLIAGTVNIIRLYDDTVIIGSVLKLI